MTRRCPLFPLLFTVLLLAIPALAGAESLPEQPPQFFQIRSTDPRVNAALEQGLRESPTFRDLVQRINTSNVVVYVTAEMATPSPGLDGCLTFVSSIGGFRYVVVRVNSNMPITRLVALLGHELQHAREIADSDAIVDSASLAREYATRIGYHNRMHGDDGRTFDSKAAVRAGEQVLREVLGE